MIYCDIFEIPFVFVLYLCPHVLKLRRRSVKILSDIEIWTISSNRIIARCSYAYVVVYSTAYTSGQLYTDIRRGAIVYYCSMAVQSLNVIISNSLHASFLSKPIGGDREDSINIMKHSNFHKSAKYLFCLFLLFCLSIEMKSQNYSEKYNSILQRYEFFDSRGNMIGYKKWDSILKKWEFTDLQRQNNSSEREYSTPKSPYDWEFMLKAAQIKQAQIDKQKQENAQKEAYERQERIKLKERILNNYRSASEYPERIGYGWYNVIVTDDSQEDFCKERKVLVSNGVVQRYIIDDFWENPVVYSSEIKDGHCSVKLQRRREDQYGYIQIYFMDCIMNPANPYAAPPATPGEISFWTTHKKAVKSGGIDIYIDGYYMGTLNDYFSKKDLKGKKNPSCDQLGTLKVKYKPGKYSFEGISRRAKWSGTIEIQSGQCLLQGLSN